MIILPFHVETEEDQIAFAYQKHILWNYVVSGLSVWDFVRTYQGLNFIPTLKTSNCRVSNPLTSKIPPKLVQSIIRIILQASSTDSLRTPPLIVQATQWKRSLVRTLNSSQGHFWMGELLIFKINWITRQLSEHDFLKLQQMQWGFPEMAMWSSPLPINCPAFMCDRNQPQDLDSIFKVVRQTSGISKNSSDHILIAN